MVSIRYLLKAFMRDEKHTKRELMKNCDSVEKGIDITNDDENTHGISIGDRPRSICFSILFYWGLFEVNLIALVLLNTGRENYGQQVIHKLCEEDCANYITNGLIIRQLLALYMTMGAFRNNWTLCLPWILIDSFGFFPLIPIVVSAFYKYNDLWLFSYWL